MCDWLFVDLNGLMDGTRAYPEKERSIGQGNTELIKGYPDDGHDLIVGDVGNS